MPLLLEGHPSTRLSCVCDGDRGESVEDKEYSEFILQTRGSTLATAGGMSLFEGGWW